MLPSLLLTGLLAGMAAVMVVGTGVMAPRHAAATDDPCELVKILGGADAYRECLDRHGLPAGAAPRPGSTPGSPPSVQPPISRPPVSLPTTPISPGQPLAPEDLFEQVKKSVFVVVAARNLGELRRQRVSQGSAVAVTSHRLYTNCHVVAGRTLLFLFQEGEIFEARLVDHDRDTDRCILEVEAAGLSPVAGLRDFATVRVGEKVFTVGAPHGLEHTLGEGLVSGKREYRGVNIVQTTAPISPGSSGGGLFDQQGRLVGITTFLLQDAQSLNFAIAADAFTRQQPVPAGRSGQPQENLPFIGR